MAASMEFKRKIPDNMNPWTCEVNGVKYVYEASTEQDVPEEVAHIIDAYWKSMEPVKGGSGGAGAGMMVVNITPNEDYSAFYSDKTVHEILESTKAGMIVKAVMAEQDNYVICDLANVDARGAWFSGIAAESSDKARIIAFSIDNDGYVEAVNGVISIGSGK